jgi:hypothetical protein
VGLIVPKFQFVGVNGFLFYLEGSPKYAVLGAKKEFYTAQSNNFSETLPSKNQYLTVLPLVAYTHSTSKENICYQLYRVIANYNRDFIN